MTYGKWTYLWVQHSILVPKNNHICFCGFTSIFGNFCFNCEKLHIFQVCWWYGGEPWDWEKGQCRKGNWDHFHKSGSPATRANSHYLKKQTNCNKVQIMSLIDSNSLKRFVECCKDNYCFPGIQRKPGAPAKGCWGYKWSGLLLLTQKNNIITKEK